MGDDAEVDEGGGRDVIEPSRVEFGHSGTGSFKRSSKRAELELEPGLKILVRARLARQTP
jgi:hypothetical protein